MIKRKIDIVFVKASVDSRKSSFQTEENFQKKMFRDAKELLQEIKRHCNYFGLEIDTESHWECEFCGECMVGEDDYECCDKSVIEHQLKIGQEMADCFDKIIAQ